MNLKKTVKRQYQSIVNEAAVTQLKDLKQPNEGWIASTRNALGMSAAQLGRLINRTRANVSATERSEQNEKITIQSMKTLAEAMGCKFVYAIIHAEGDIKDVIEQQARKKAIAIVNQANTHMALENQSLEAEIVNDEIERLTSDLMENINSDFWKGEDEEHH